MDWFTRGFEDGLALWRAGFTTGLISNKAASAWLDSPERSRGMHAASEALDGWTDLAEREARYHGFSREQAARLVATAVGC